MSGKQKYKKNLGGGGGRKKKKAWKRGKQTQMPVTITEGLAATGKG